MARPPPTPCPEPRCAAESLRMLTSPVTNGSTAVGGEAGAEEAATTLATLLPGDRASRAPNLLRPGCAKARTLELSP